MASYLNAFSDAIQNQDRTNGDRKMKHTNVVFFKWGKKAHFKANCKY